MKSDAIKRILCVAVATIIMLSASVSFSTTRASAATTSKYGVGQGVKWPEQVCALLLIWLSISMIIQMIITVVRFH